MRFIFVIQGEGRGHMTQAIALSRILIDAGHEVSRVLIGRSKAREIPSFFRERISQPVETFNSPNFVRDSENKGIRIIPTIFSNLWKIRKYLNSARYLREILKSDKPDAVINFYEFMAGMVYFFYRPDIPMFCIGHQYLMLHPEFPFPGSGIIDRYLLRLNTKITSAGAKLLFALSFREMTDIPGKRLIVMPPLLRQEVLSLEPEAGGYLHGYILNSGYAGEIMNWHKRNPDAELHFFWDNNEAGEETEISPGLTFHKINDVKFLQYMRACKGFATTAGFESVCEAMYLNKPVLMVPVAGHFEQECNAFDAMQSGAGVISKNFDLTKLTEYIPNHHFNHKLYLKWVERAAEIFLAQI